MNKETLNVWAGTDENAWLSNLASRRFTYEGRVYVSVEHAYQTLKGGVFNEHTYNLPWTPRKKFSGGAYTAKHKTRGIMSDLIRASMDQNPTVKKALVDTGDVTITHLQDSGYWRNAFPEILMELREEFQMDFLF